MGGADVAHVFDLKLSWQPDAANYFNCNPDPAVNQPSWIAASGGQSPKRPIAIARSAPSMSRGREC